MSRYRAAATSPSKPAASRCPTAVCDDSLRYQLVACLPCAQRHREVSGPPARSGYLGRPVSRARGSICGMWGLCDTRANDFTTASSAKRAARAHLSTARGRDSLGLSEGLLAGRWWDGRVVNAEVPEQFGDVALDRPDVRSGRRPPWRRRRGSQTSSATTARRDPRSWSVTYGDDVGSAFDRARNAGVRQRQRPPAANPTTG